jgi:branched-chain amino acid transport system permease protein
MNKPTKWILPLIVAAAGAFLPLALGAYPQAVARSVFIYMALAITWDMLLRSGQISFGIAGFFGLGSYAAAMAAVKAGMPPAASILLAAVFAAVVALVLGMLILRLRAIYFSITTLALAEIFKVIIHNWSSFTGGPEGLVLESVMFKGNSELLYWLSFGMVLVTVGVSVYFEKSRLHFALTAIRNNETSARSSGVNIFANLIVVFVVTSFLQGLIGGIQVMSYGFAMPDSAFDANYTLLPLAMALLGGVHSTWGPIIGAILLGVASEFLKLKIPYGHLMVYGFIIILVILFMPNGIYGIARNARRKRNAQS